MNISKQLFIMLFCAVISLTNCNNNSGTHSENQQIRQKSPEELRMELKQQEQLNPANWLTAHGNYRENFWGDKFKVSCTIANKASIATFKDAVVRVTYYSKTKTELGAKDYTLYEMFPPLSSKTIEMTVDNYKDVSTIGLTVINAVPTE